MITLLDMNRNERDLFHERTNARGAVQGRRMPLRSGELKLQQGSDKPRPWIAKPASRASLFRNLRMRVYDIREHQGRPEWILLSQCAEQPTASLAAFRSVHFYNRGDANRPD